MEEEEYFRPMPCWLAEHGEALGYASVVMVQDGMTAWSGTDGTLPQAVDSWLRRAEEHVREHSSLGDDEDGWLTTRPALDVRVDVEERWDLVRVSHDVVDRLAYFLRTDIGLPLPDSLGATIAYVVTWAARLPRPEERVPEEDTRPRPEKWKPGVARDTAPREELRAWARGWRRRYG